MALENNDQYFCWERVLKSNSLFRVSHLFAPQEFAGQLLALHALFASIDQVRSEVSEELVARKKLDWWRFELLPGNISKSRDEALVSNHLMVACKGGMLQLLRESYAQADHAFWWVPLNKLARFGVSRQELRENSDSDASRSLFREVLDVCHLPESSDGVAARMNVVPLPGLVHLQLMALLQSRQLGQLQRKKPSSHGTELNRWRVSDLLAAWRAARHLKVKAPIA
jgi:hypothetical protein